MALFGLLLLAAVQDSVQLKISNVICIVVLLLAGAAVLTVGPSWALWQNLVVFGAALTVGTWLFGRGWLGGGDVKLFAVTALWFDLNSAMWLLIAVAVAGGVLAFVIMALRVIGWPDALRRRVKILQAKAGIPYGIAIAGGAVLLVAMLSRPAAGLA